MSNKIRKEFIEDLGTGGIADEYTRVVTTPAELLSALTGTERNLLITKNIALTADITLPNNAVLKYGGGIINANGFDVKFANNELTDCKFNFFTGTINDTSTFKNVVAIKMENFGLVGDGNITTNSGSDNRNLLLQLQKIAHKTGCDLEIHKEGNYLYSLVESAANGNSTPTNFYVTGSTNIFLGKKVVFGALTNANYKYKIIEFYESKHAKIYGQGEVVGDLRTHDFSGTTSEGCFGVTTGQKCDNVIIEVNIRECPGDCFISTHSPNFYYLNDLKTKRVSTVQNRVN